MDLTWLIKVVEADAVALTAIIGTVTAHSTFRLAAPAVRSRDDREEDERGQ